ncbi:MAG: ATP-dependent RNA helicase RhlE, partial [Desulfuromonadales bacterium]|nr:ATP-dependent RNA helicase RhlE [Desulfuromonadales bacterium]
EDGVALSLLCREEQPLLTAIEKLLKYTIPRQIIAEFPQIAVRRSVKTKEVKNAPQPTKSKKRLAQAKANAPSAPPPPRKKRVVEEKPAIKVGRRVSRMK